MFFLVSPFHNKYNKTSLEYLLGVKIYSCHIVNSVIACSRNSPSIIGRSRILQDWSFCVRMVVLGLKILVLDLLEMVILDLKNTRKCRSRVVYSSFGHFRIGPSQKLLEIPSQWSNEWSTGIASYSIHLTLFRFSVSCHCHCYLICLHRSLRAPVCPCRNTVTWVIPVSMVYSDH